MQTIKQGHWVAYVLANPTKPKLAGVSTEQDWTTNSVRSFSLIAFLLADMIRKLASKDEKKWRATQLTFPTL